jgi:A/G-specific adenine glycosylase
MPWREDPTPYKVWISEIMLQQTQVATVIPYFERFIARFPDVQSLAGSDPQAVLQCWEGLGYYSRARHLQAAAKQISSLLNGRFPETADGWKRLPGVGDYTAAAIASIACGKPEPAVDGNVLRVYSRLRAVRDDITQPALRNAFREQLRPVIQTVDPSAFNQAMMELGALVCRPRQPLCEACPLKPHCKAHSAELTDVIPFKPRKAAVPHYHEVAVIITNAQGEVLLYRRPEKGLLGGLWAFPQARRQGREPYRQVLLRAVATVLPSTTVSGIRKRSVVKHAFSHFSQTIHVYTCQPETPAMPPPTPADQSWCLPGKLDEMPLSKADRAIANLR